MGFRFFHVLAMGSIVVLLASCSASRGHNGARDQLPHQNALLNPPTSVTSEPGENTEQEQTATTAQTGARFFPGTGRFVDPSPISLPVAEVKEDGDITLNFIDVDIRGLIDAILGEMFDYNYIVDPSINGTITLQTAEPIAREDVIPALESVLRLNDAAIVQRDGLFHVVPLGQAPRALGKPDVNMPENRNVPGFRVQIVPLQYTGAAEMAKLLEPFAPAGGILRVDTTRNHLMLAGTRNDLETLRQAIDMFDVDWLEGMSFGLFELEYSEPQPLISDLREVIAGPGSPIGELVRLVPIPRLRSIMVITPREEYLRKVGTWIERLDLGGDNVGERRIYVYDVQNGRADDLAGALNKILALDGGTSTTDTQTGTAGTAGTTSVTESTTGNGSRIVSNEVDNTLLILATPKKYRVIKSALDRMDVMPRQVLIEAVLAEVSLTDELRYGVQWFFESGDHSVTLSNASGGSVSSEFPGFSYVFSGSADSRTVLNAIASVTDVNVISAPKLMVLDNQTANLQVGDEVPVVTQSVVGVTDPDAPIVNSVQFRDTGVILNVTPHINNSGLVLMEVAQELSEVAPTTTSGIDSPTIQQRKVESSVAVQSGETIALGGLIRENQNRTNSGVPLLKDIPLLGNVFKTNTRSTRRTELIVLITPRIIRDAAESRQVMDHLRDQFLSLEPFRKGENDPSQ